MACADDYTSYYRWEWFRRNEWRQSFRQWKRHSSSAFVEMLRGCGRAAAPILDCSCGLGLKTIAMREAGLNVQGADRCEFAVECARSLSEEEGHPDIPYFVSTWADLPRRTKTRYAAVFNDALSWVHSDEEMAESLRGLHDCLLPKGVLAYMGALPGTEDDRRQVLEQEWAKRTVGGVHWLGMQASDGVTSVQEVVFLEKGEDFIDEHHVYIVDSGGTRHAENWCLRCSLKWSWGKIRPLLEGAGFSSFGTKEFVAANGKPFHLVLAERE